MRIVVFSDIHGNRFALDAMLADLRSETVDRMVCLGDAVQGGPQPAETVARLRELACPVVMGNADDFLLTGKESGAEPITAERRRKLEIIREWQLTKLSANDLAFIRTFQPTVEIPLDEDRRLLCFHGSPKSFDDVMLPLTPDEDMRQFLDPQPNTIYTGGHTHVQFMRHFGRAFHFNPGSVGLAYRHDQPEDDVRCDPWAEYAILNVTKERVSVEFRRVPYDLQALIAIYHESGRPFAAEDARQYQA
jgi:predicted phosphodiesterase